MKLSETYKKQIMGELKKEFNYSNDLAVPRVGKVIINIGVGKLTDNKKALEDIEKGLTLISGQKPSPTKAKKSISSFKVREGMMVGYKVTLRSQRAYDFLERLINIALPRTRDFRGLKKDSFDAKGNYTLGIKENVIFPEINQQEIPTNFGMEITIITTAKNKEEAEALLRKMGMPLVK